MQTTPITPETLAQSVVAVPPLARREDFSLHADANRDLIRYLEAGGVSTLLYGGNAVLYHVALSDYATLLEMLAESVASQTLVIPSVGPAYGLMMDQAKVLKEFEFPTAMILPQREIATPQGIAAAVRHFVDALERPAVLYIKHDGYIDVELVKKLMDDQYLSWIKYAVVRDNPADDDYLRGLVNEVGPERIVSGIGEQPAITHLTQFGLAGFTSGCVCVAPRLSMDMLHALQTGDVEKAERIRNTFRPLEDLRNHIHPIRVLHAAVELVGIAETGPLIPLLSEVDAADRQPIQAAARDLRAAEEAAHVAS